MNSLHVKTGDTAVVLSGKEKGKRGKVIKVMPKKGMVVLRRCELCNPPSEADPPGRGRWYHQEGRRNPCLQSYEGLPEVRQADPPGCKVP